MHYYDVGIAGDGLWGEKRDGPTLNDPLLGYNSNSEWTADQQAPERWELVDGVPQLVEGGKHYGHLEINVKRIKAHEQAGVPAATQPAVRVKLTPVHVFPVLDANYNLVRTERRTYDAGVTLVIAGNGQVLH